MALSTSKKEGPATSTPDVISERLRRAIISGELEEGLQLRQEELAIQFGTSRIPIREALRQLEAEGWVTIYPNRGAVVSTLSLAQVLEMMEIRIALECRALRLAVPNMVDEDFQEAESILSIYDKERDPSNWAEMNWRFHKLLYAPCHMERLLSLIELNYGQVGRFMRTKVSRAAGKEQP